MVQRSSCTSDVSCTLISALNTIFSADTFEPPSIRTSASRDPASPAPGARSLRTAARDRAAPLGSGAPPNHRPALGHGRSARPPARARSWYPLRWSPSPARRRSASVRPAPAPDRARIDCGTGGCGNNQGCGARSPATNRGARSALEEVTTSRTGPEPARRDRSGATIR